MKIDKLILSEFNTNCYVISHNFFALLVDPGSNGNEINDFLIANNLTLKAILLTHGHQDHIGAVDYLYNKYHCDIYASIYEKEIITGENKDKILKIPSFEGFEVKSPVIYLEGEFNTLHFDGLDIDAILTPGHSEGSLTYVIKNYKRIFSGDVLFKNSIGRTDFPTSNYNKLRESLEIYKHFDLECRVNPGHGENTTIADELQYNQYLKQ